MTQHTPGPWEVSAIYPDKAKGHTFEPRVSILGLCTLVGAEGRKVRLADIPDVPGPDSEEAANARLFAAAPDGLAANKMALAYIADELTETSRDEDPDAWAIVDALRAAIAKATGSP